jgi:transposase
MSAVQTATVEAADITALQTENEALKEQLQSLKVQLDWFKRQLFGERSEKRLLIDPAIQADLLASLGNATNAPPLLPEKQTISYERRKPRADGCINDQGLRFDATVPVEIIRMPLPAALADVPVDQQSLISEKISYRLAQRPGSYVILKYIRPVVQRNDTQELISTPAPASVLEKSIADVSFLAGMLVDKFVYHLPLYRQHQRLLQSGITLSRTTLGNLASRAIDLLEPIYTAQFRHIRQSRVIAMDETPIKAGRKKKGKLRQAYFWPIYGEADEIAFSYSSSRAARQVREVLGDDFKGTLISDGYEAYDNYARHHPLMTHAQCWAHTRRYFEKAKDAEPGAAAEALALIGTLYRHEEAIRDKGLVAADKFRYRTKYSEPVVTAFRTWCEEQCRRHDLLPSNPLTKALKYAMARTEQLKVFLSDPEVPIDTNHLERALRPIPMGRRNWLFCWTELGAKQVGIIQSLLVTCKLHGIHPHTYLVDVLQRISQHPASEVLELTPRLWKERFAGNPLRSDLDAGNRDTGA